MMMVGRAGSCSSVEVNCCRIGLDWIVVLDEEESVE